MERANEIIDAAGSIIFEIAAVDDAVGDTVSRAAPASEDDLRLMRRLDEQYLATPFYGSRRMVSVLRREGEAVNRKRVRRLMRLMGLEAIYQKRTPAGVTRNTRCTLIFCEISS